MLPQTMRGKRYLNSIQNFGNYFPEIIIFGQKRRKLVFCSPRPKVDSQKHNFH